MYFTAVSSYLRFAQGFFLQAFCIFYILGRRIGKPEPEPDCDSDFDFHL